MNGILYYMEDNNIVKAVENHYKVNKDDEEFTIEDRITRLEDDIAKILENIGGME